jgi:hypothetical protein
MIASKSGPTVATTCEGLRKVPRRMAAIMVKGSLPENGTTPVTSSYSMAPKRPQIGGRVTSCPRDCSGDIYAGEPTSAPVAVMVSMPVMWATPKSVSTTRLPCPLISIMTLSGFHVAVDDPVFVRGGQGLGQGQGDERGDFWQEAPAAFFQKRAQGRALDQLDHDVAGLVFGGADEVVDLDDGGVLERGHGVRLTPEALAGAAAGGVDHAHHLDATSRPSWVSRARKTVAMAPWPRVPTIS